MRELIIGNGLLGNDVYETLNAEGAKAFQASRRPDEDDSHAYYVDMLDRDSITKLLTDVEPDTIINTAAILGRKGDHELLPNNPIFTRNLLESVHDLGLNPRIVILGSGAVYGEVEMLPATEDTPMNAQDPYGRSKRKESEVARILAGKYNLDVAEARVGNPLSPKLPGTNLSTIILQQIQNIRNGEQEPVISIRSTESTRDYTDLQNVTDGIIRLGRTLTPDAKVFNVASGEATTNGELAEMLLWHAGMPDIKVRATSGQLEPTVGASHMDVSRLRELGWEPRITLDETVANLVAAGLSLEDDLQQPAA